VIYGFDGYDLPGTYALHPLSQVVVEAPERLARLVLQRARQHAALWLLPCLLLVVVWWRRAEARPEALRTALVCCAGSVAYFFLFVALSYYTTARLLLPLAAFLAIATAVVAGHLLLPRAPRLGWALVAVLLLAYGARQVSDVRPVLARVERHWQDSTILTTILRQSGLRDAREALVFDWDRFLVDESDLQPFYNFGFWNLLVERFREERPSPLPHLGSLEAFAAFLARQDVQFVVIPRRLRRFPALHPLQRWGGTIPGFRRVAVLREEIVFARLRDVASDTVPSPP